MASPQRRFILLTQVLTFCVPSWIELDLLQVRRSSDTQSLALCELPFTSNVITNRGPGKMERKKDHERQCIAYVDTFHVLFELS